MNSDEDIAHWISIHNNAFGRNWNKNNFSKSVVNHKDLNIYHTYFLMDREKHIGAASVGVFRRNENIGVTHYAALIKERQGQGLGKYLIQYRYHKLREVGVTVCENETKIGYPESIRIHFDCGAQIKTKPDYWNTQDRSFILLEYLALFRAKKLLQRYTHLKKEYPEQNESLNNLIQATFNLPPDVEIVDKQGPGDLAGWDSLGHVNLITALAARYKLSLTADEVLSIENIGSIRQLLASKGIKE